MVWSKFQGQKAIEARILTASHESSWGYEVAWIVANEPWNKHWIVVSVLLATNGQNGAATKSNRRQSSKDQEVAVSLVVLDTRPYRVKLPKAYPSQDNACQTGEGREERSKLEIKSDIRHVYPFASLVCLTR